MHIQIPGRHYKYIRALVDAGIFPTEQEAIAFVFDRGLDLAEFDATYAGEPDMDIGLLAGKPITLEVPSKTKHFSERLQLISKGYAVPEPKAATIAFLQGLFDHYLTLKGTTLYRTSVRFRKMVNRMPHDLCYEPVGCDLDLEMSAEAQWQGRRLGYCKLYGVNVVDANLPGNGTGLIHVGDTNYRCVDCDYLEASSRLPYRDTVEVAEMLNVSACTVREHIKSGRLAAFLVERHPRLNLGEYIAPRKFLVMRKEAHAYRKRYQTRNARKDYSGTLTEFPTSCTVPGITASGSISTSSRRWVS